MIEQGMKKIMWIMAMLPAAVTSIALQFMPDTIPMHHDLAGNTDRWGSKMESFVFPAVILLVTLFWHRMVCMFEKKAAEAKTEKEQREAESSAKALCVTGILQAVMFGIMHCFILYSSWEQANTGAAKMTVDIARVSCILIGIMLIIAGSYMTKARKNAAVGLRTVWSMYNDNTWRKSNRFGAICIMAAGLLAIVTTAFADGMASTVMLLIYLLFAAVVAAAYSKRVCDREKEADNICQIFEEDKK